MSTRVSRRSGRRVVKKSVSMDPNLYREAMRRARRLARELGLSEDWGAFSSYIQRLVRADVEAGVNAAKAEVVEGVR